MGGPRLALNDGLSMPALGLGVWKAPRGACYEAVQAALACGYRRVDTARIYANEKDVGRAIQESGLPRSDVFVTTKLWNADQGYDAARTALEKSLKDLGLAQVDLYLVHFPQRKTRGEAWRALEKAKAEGLVKSIGVSNYTMRHLDELLATAKVAPAVNQVEFHPFLYQRELLERCKKAGVVLEAYSPLAHGEKIGDPRIAAVAQRVGRTNAQVMIRWALEHGCAVIPKSVRKARIEENFGALDFTLDAAAMKELDGLNEDLRTCWDPSDEP